MRSISENYVTFQPTIGERNTCHAVSNANKGKKLLQPQSPRGFSALARLYYLARPTKTAMLRRLFNDRLP